MGVKDKGEWELLEIWKVGRGWLGKVEWDGGIDGRVMGRPGIDGMQQFTSCHALAGEEGEQNS